MTALGARSVVSFPGVVCKLVRLIRARGIDTVFSFLVHANMVAASARPFCPGVRWLQSIQTTQPNPRWHWRVQAIVQHAAEQIIVPSPSTADMAHAWAGVPFKKIVVIPNAIDPIAFCDTTPPLELLDLDSRTQCMDVTTHRAPRVGFIGRLDPIKRIPDLLEAMRLLEDSVQLHIFGEGTERPSLETLIAQRGLKSRVVLHGAVARPQEALGQIDLLVLPSSAEGFGLVLIEAMAAGVPVVATNVPGIRDVVQDGITGILVPVASPADLAQAIQSLLNNPSRRAALVQRAQMHVREHYSWEKILPQYQSLLA